MEVKVIAIEQMMPERQHSDDAAYGEGSLSEWWGRLQFIVLDEEDFPNPREVFEGLADLIDPEGGSDED